MASGKGSMKKSNLDRFLHCTTPSVPPQEFFRLSDLWDCYDEWSAYGASVPIHLSNRESLVQYYVPYLSAIQIFTSPSSLLRLREESEDGESDGRYPPFSDSGSDESVSEERLENNPNDLSSPYTRVPLMDKINELAQRYPQLMSLRSVDLSPASWMSVAWYPIYHIPMGRTIKDLSTCFLTYHTLSSSFQDMERPEENGGDKERMRKEGEDITLSPFGMATHKMQVNVWLSHDQDDQEKLVSLYSVADSWLKQLRVQHHDFNYFYTMSMTYRIF
ncbi:unnamed protein product [Brassica oleracea]